MYDILKSIIAIANELDLRGLEKEASELDSIASNIINFKERAEKLREEKGDVEPDELDEEALGEGEPAEVIDFSKRTEELKTKKLIGKYSDEEVGAALAFLMKFLMPDSLIDGEVEVKIFAKDPSLKESFEEYIIHDVVDGIYNLSKDLSMEPHAALELIVSVAKSLPAYSLESDLHIIINRVMDILYDEE